MSPSTNIFQRFKKLSTRKSSTKEAQPHPFASSQTLDFITKVNANPTFSSSILNPQYENHANNAEGIVTESFWPNIRKYILNDDPNAKPMKAICAICWDELHVTCISSPDEKLDIALVAPCGHIMCPRCWPRKVFDYYAENFVAKRKCPICKTGLECVVCKKTCNKEMIPTYGGKASIESFPETAPECGREYRPFCKGCSGIIDWDADGFWYENIEERDSMNSS